MDRLKFRLNIVIRILLVILLGYGAYYFYAFTPFWLMTFWFTLFAIITLINLIYYIEKSYRELTNFLLAIRQRDFSSIYPEKESHSKSLNRVFNIISKEFMSIRNEKESNFLFFKTVVEHSGVPLLAYDIDSQKVLLVNQAFQSLLSIHHITLLNSLEKKYPELYQLVKRLYDGERELIKVKAADEELHLSVTAKKLKLLDSQLMVAAFHNINSELDQKEIESWQKLIRVMTHEIKNSVIPISTLAEVVNQMINESENEEDLSHLNQEDIEDLKISLKTIDKRSKGLVKFVDAYGNLSKVPQPKLRKTNINELIEYIVGLEKPEARKKECEILTYLPSQIIEIDIDPEMIEQVLINLIKNAIEAVSGSKGGTIRLELRKKEGFAIIQVIDNGSGMDQETLDNIFVPFYTTKKDGSGIGLSLSRQIIKSHKGNLKVTSQPGEGTSFEITLPAQVQ